MSVGFAGRMASAYAIRHKFRSFVNTRTKYVFFATLKFINHNSIKLGISYFEIEIKKNFFMNFLTILSVIGCFPKLNFISIILRL